MDNQNTSFLKEQNQLPEKAFTSYDGVDIMVGQECYFFIQGTEHINSIADPHIAKLSDNQEPNDDVIPTKFFSSYKAIYEYATLKHPCISIDDLSPWMNEDNEFNNIKIDDLFKIVKEKLKNNW